jgi:hypothetical protein
MLDTVERLLDSYYVSANFKKENKDRVVDEKNLFCGSIFTTFGVCTDAACSACG